MQTNLDDKKLCITNLKIICWIITTMIICQNAYSTNFVSKYPCTDGVKTCTSSGNRVVEGVNVYRDCWEWSYTKQCDYPSLNDCDRLSHCYEVALNKCLLEDSLGNCVNQRKEFSCKRWVPAIVESKKVRTSLEAKDGVESIICKGVPCLDGNCVDKSYDTNGEMMDSIAKLSMLSQAKSSNDPNFKLFEGFAQHCSKKATQYTNCCSVRMGGWGNNIGAKCNSAEKLLLENRKKNLCVYVGKQNIKSLGITTVIKHHYCCFSNLLNKVVQVEGRKQLKMTFGSGGSPDCRGLTLEELQRLDFEKIDFSEFIEDFKLKFFSKYKKPNANDLVNRIKGSMPDIKKYNYKGALRYIDQNNNKTGFNNTVGQDLQGIDK